MTRTCAYPACHTGSNVSRRNNKYNNIRNKSLFKFPRKDLPQRKQWEEVIGRAAKDHEVICEDHFPVNKIVRDYKIYLPNGNVDVVERGITRLQPDAVPFLYLPVPLPEHDYAKKDALKNAEKSEPIKQDNENTIVNVKPQNNINNVQQNIILNNLKNVEINQQIVNGIQNNIPALIQVDKQHPPPLIWRLPVDNKSNNTKTSSATLTPITPMTTGLTFLIAKELTPPTKIVNKQNELPVPSTPVTLTPVTPITIKPAPTSTTPKPITITTTPKPITITPTSTPMTTTPTPISMPITSTSTTPATATAPITFNIRKRFSHKKTEKIKTIDEPEKWDLDKLYNELSIVYDDKMKWGVIRVENKLSIIVFDNLIHPKKQMIVFYDLTYEVRINCRKIFVPGLKENTSIDNVVHNIRVLHKLVPCEGPGGGESPALSCSGYASVDGSRVRYGHLRCQICNELRKKILRKRAYDIKVEKRLFDKIKSLRRTVKLTKAKLKRVKARYGDKKDIDELLNTEESDDDDFLNVNNS